MPVWIHNIETIVPYHSYQQDFAGRKMAEWQSDERKKRFVRAIYKKSGISKRHSVIENFYGGGPGSFFKIDGSGKMIEPATKERNDIYAEHSRSLSVELARRAIEKCPGIGREDISHVITASCTGFYAPGPDYHIVEELGLSRSTQRYHLGFMGCYAAIPALRMAAQFCQANPAAVVLVMCLELCTIHLHLDSDEDTLMANSLFADGAGAAIVSSREPDPSKSRYQVGNFSSSIVAEGREDMAWKIGNRGFDMTLSSYVPKIIGSNIGDLIGPALGRSGIALSDVATWAVHPGGKAIVDRVQTGLGLTDPQVQASRHVLGQYGNMSSATIFFVLKEILRNPGAPGSEEVCAITFGPGLTVETAILQAQRVHKGEFV